MYGLSRCCRHRYSGAADGTHSIASGLGDAEGHLFTLPESQPLIPAADLLERGAAGEPRTLQHTVASRPGT